MHRKPALLRQSAALIPARRPSRAAIVAGVFVIAIGLRAMNVWRPMDGSIWNIWREADTAAVARNFDREGMNIFYPRIDWRGDGPGFVASGLPLMPYVGAILFRVFGNHEQYLRLISLAAGVLGCYVFWRLADRVLPRWAAVIAFAFFASHPLLVASASWVQSESLLLLAYVAAIDQFDRWTQSRRWNHYFAAWLATTLSILILLPAAHLAIVFALIAVRRFGKQAVRRIDLWMFAAWCAVPPLLWYVHAYSLWREYGHSLGIFSETFQPSQPGSLAAISSSLLGVIAIEAASVWAPTGLVVALPALRSVWASNGALIVEWCVALVAYYLFTAGTTGAPDFFYYHVVSVPVVALAIGMSSQLLFDAAAARPLDLRVGRGAMRQIWLAIAAIAAVYALVGGAVHYLVEQSLLLLAIASGVGLIGSLVLIYLGRWARGRSPRARSRRFRVWLVGLVMAASLTAGWNVAEIRRYFQGKPEVFARYEAALQFGPRLRDGGPIAIAGAARRRAAGRPMGASAPYFFYWLDRKGFAVPPEDLDIEALANLSRRGVRFLIVEREAWDRAPVLEGILRRRFRVVEDHPLATLFDLMPPEGDAQSAASGSGTGH